MINSHRTEARPGRKYANLLLRALFLAALASVTSNQPAASQQNSTAAPKQPASKLRPGGSER